MATVEERQPELFKPDLQIDRQSGVRTVPMEVMNLGFPRTGTMCKPLIPKIVPFLSHQNCKLPRLIDSWLAALRTALNIPGYRCYHPILWFSNSRDCAAWNAAQDAKLFLRKGNPPSPARNGTPPSAPSAPSPPIPPPSPSPQELIATCPDAGIILVERAGRRSVVHELRQSYRPAVVEPVSDFPGRLGSVDHGPRAGYAVPVVVQSGV